MGPVGLQLPGKHFFYLGCSGSTWPDNIEGSGSSTVVLFENVWNFYFFFFSVSNNKLFFFSPEIFDFSVNC